jgi:tetratricopeptide (TPR) repeat protein
LVSQALNRHGEAQQYFQESITLWREIGDEGNLAPTLNYLGDTFAQGDNRAHAQQCFEEALAAANNAGVMPAVLDSLLGLATLQVQRGETATTHELLTHIHQHPASTQKARQRAEKLQATLEAQLPPSIA